MNTLVRYRPNGVNLFKNFDAMVNSLFSEDMNIDTRNISVDIREDEDKYVLEAELAGVSEKDVDINVENDMLTISSSREEKNEEKKEGYILKERRSSSFCRSFMLPKDVDTGKIDASVKDGVLTLDMPKRPEAKPKKISVKAK